MKSVILARCFAYHPPKIYTMVIEVKQIYINEQIFIVSRVFSKYFGQFIFDFGEDQT